MNDITDPQKEIIQYILSNLREASSLTDFTVVNRTISIKTLHKYLEKKKVHISKTAIARAIRAFLDDAGLKEEADYITKCGGVTGTRYLLRLDKNKIEELKEKYEISKKENIIYVNL